MTRNALTGRIWCLAMLVTAGFVPLSAIAGAQVEEQLANSVVAGLAKDIADAPMPTDYVNRPDVWPWVKEMSPRIAHKVTDERERRELLAMVYYEASRSALDPRLILAVIYHESGFKKYAISYADARGYMQVMPFWVKQIGRPDQNLFNVRTNLRYGTVILHHYLAMENGDLYRALGRYNGSVGKPEYPVAVLAALNRHFQYPDATKTVANAVGNAVPR